MDLSGLGPGGRHRLDLLAELDGAGLGCTGLGRYALSG